MHLCELAAIAGGIALLWKSPLAGELLYFWGLAATLNGLITPTAKLAFPHPVCISFFWLHAPVVIAAFYWVGGLRRWPRPRAVWRVSLWSLLYMIVAGFYNYLAQTNFGFLRHKPETASAFDLLGPAPWYVLWVIPVGFVLYSLLYSPFFLLRKLGKVNA